MDQVKVVLAAVKKHHFWVLCGVMVVVVLVVWWMATAGLASRIEKRAGELETTYKSVQDIASASQHPNENCIASAAAEHKKLTDEVYNAWNSLYWQQKQNNQWPDLGSKFNLFIRAAGPDDPIPADLRDTYMNFIKNHLPALCEIVDARLPAERDERGMIKKDANGKPIRINPFARVTASGGTGVGGLGGIGGMGGMGAEMPMGGDMYGGAPDMPMGGTYPATGTARDEGLVGKVDWSSNDLQRIGADFFWNTRPTTIQVRLAQEDLWVYEALLRIIARTNEGSTSNYNAAVKAIRALEIGQRAAAAFAQSRISGPRGGMMPGAMPGAAGAGAEGDMTMPGGGGMYGAGEPEGMMYSAGGPEGMYGAAGAMAAGMYGPGAGAAGGTTTAGLSPEDLIKGRLLHRRYVDEKGIPLPATGTPPSVAFPFAEFKMMPVRMLLVADQRRVAKLLVNCANSSMPVEVRQVAINPGKGGTLNLGGFGPGMGSGMMGMGATGYPGYGGGSDMPSGEGTTDMYGGAGPMYGEQGMGIGGGGPTGGMVPGRRPDQQASYDVDLEVQGIIYIFNPPDREKLGTGGAASEPTGPAASTTPAVAPPAAAGPTPPPGPPAAGPAASPAAPATPPGGPAASPPPAAPGT